MAFFLLSNRDPVPLFLLIFLVQVAPHFSVGNVVKARGKDRGCNISLGFLALAHGAVDLTKKKMTTLSVLVRHPLQKEINFHPLCSFLEEKGRWKKREGNHKWTLKWTTFFFLLFGIWTPLVTRIITNRELTERKIEKEWGMMERMKRGNSKMSHADGAR